MLGIAEPGNFACAFLMCIGQNSIGQHIELSKVALVALAQPGVSRRGGLRYSSRPRR
jgi:hypothetical protein